MSTKLNNKCIIKYIGILKIKFKLTNGFKMVEFSKAFFGYRFHQ